MEHKPEILLVDVDGTLTKETCYTADECLNATPNKDMIEWSNKQYEYHFIIIYTARRHALYHPTMDWLNKHGVKYHAVQFEKTPGKIVDLDAINKI